MFSGNFSLGPFPDRFSWLDKLTSCGAAAAAAAAAAGGILDPDEDGEYFLDRSYKHFDAILSYLRTGVSILPDSDKSLKEMLLECEYYQLDELVHMLEEKLGVVSKFVRPVKWSTSIHHRASTVQVSADGSVATGKGCILTSEPVTKGRVYFEITYDEFFFPHLRGGGEAILAKFDHSTWL